MIVMKPLAVVATAGLFWVASSACAQSTVPFASDPKPVGRFVLGESTASQSTLPSTSAPKSLRAKFKVKVESITLAEGGLVHMTVILSDELKISFMQPNGCSYSIQAEERKISFSAIQSQIGLTVRVLTSFSLPDDAGILARFHEIYKDAQIQPIAEVISSAGPGRSCDIQRVFKNVSVMITRHAFIPFSGGCLEIVFTTDAASFEARRFAFTWLMNSLKIEPRPASE